MLLPEARKTYIIADREEELELSCCVLSETEYEGNHYVLLCLDEEADEDEQPSDMTEACVFCLCNEETPLLLKDPAGNTLACLRDADAGCEEAVTDRLLDLI